MILVVTFLIKTKSISKTLRDTASINQMQMSLTKLEFRLSQNDSDICIGIKSQKHVNDLLARIFEYNFLSSETSIVQSRSRRGVETVQI